MAKQITCECGYVIRGDDGRRGRRRRPRPHARGSSRPVRQGHRRRPSRLDRGGLRWRPRRSTRAPTRRRRACSGKTRRTRGIAGIRCSTSWLGEATELMLDLARVGEGSRVLDIAAGSGGQSIAAAPPRRGRARDRHLRPDPRRGGARRRAPPGVTTLATRVLDGEQLDVDARVVRRGDLAARADVPAGQAGRARSRRGPRCGPADATRRSSSRSPSGTASSRCRSRSSAGAPSCRRRRPACRARSRAANLGDQLEAAGFRDVEVHRRRGAAPAGERPRSAPSSSASRSAPCTRCSPASPRRSARRRGRDRGALARVRGPGRLRRPLRAAGRRGHARALKREARRRPRRAASLLLCVHLKAIKLRGFKSFVDPVEIHLEPGVAVVVGPNGSGKSNVSDSILWATGSMSPDELRAEKPDDVLFAGSAGRAPVDFCEVELMFDNADGAWPDLPFSEVSVARRLHRGGEGQYLVNRPPCAGSTWSSCSPTSASGAVCARSSRRMRYRN